MMPTKQRCPECGEEFVGDFSFWVGRMNPDFICRKKNKIIEFFGNYWHNKDDVINRSSNFYRNGYKSLFIWESELINIEQIKNKIRIFHERI